ncbi:hypothetical protein FACS1894151_11440 [Spirochaetia bacterium]|nr:hypothetical protein FACS1894151_11440 [Spirochaetia bacterium]
MKACFILLHLKDGELLGGLYRKGSFASSYPEKQDLYISELWKVDGKGAFKTKVKNSGGVLVSFDEIKFIEIFTLSGSSIATYKPEQKTTE